ncbi:hypothetical protein SRABI118_04909 [Massilia sp. Bi118]|uniref:DUF3619 family protein n=1 Tax=Massilia sp. Bi118 TaxID=2822346 RepID=UPI001D3C94E9|nr:DUF3619 family protein [Massilia sp. Bi118]CAH0313712.1 hypothetical protein SRABI118_04909 [Massilia sp. Bi118]
MNTDDINLAYKVRHALNENLENLPASTTDRLAAARALALSRKKADAPQSRKQARFDVASLLGMQWVRGLAVAAPLLAMVIGLAGVYQSQHEQRAAELADLDAAVLSDDLPLTAYTDHGFNAYLAEQQQQAPQRAQ